MAARQDFYTESCVNLQLFLTRILYHAAPPHPVLFPPEISSEGYGYRLCRPWPSLRLRLLYTSTSNLCHFVHVLGVNFVGHVPPAQSLKAVVVDAETLETVASAAVGFAEAFPGSGVDSGGVVRGPDGQVTQPTLMVTSAACCGAAA